MTVRFTYTYKQLCDTSKYIAQIWQSHCTQLQAGAQSQTCYTRKKALLSNCRVWRQPKEKKQPISREMFEAMASEYTVQRKYGNHGRYPVLLDLACLACYTGSRLSKCGVSRTEPGSAFPTIPQSREVPKAWRGRLVAFIPEDSSFTISE